MSDHFTILVAEDPASVPENINAERALAYFAEIAPEADEIRVEYCDYPQFFDCGQNFQSVYCPACKSQIGMDWWHGCVDEDFSGEGFLLKSYPAPCCGGSHTLHELRYDWPQGIGRFALEAMNPGIGRLSELAIQQFEKILGVKLRVIYRHI